MNLDDDKIDVYYDTIKDPQITKLIKLYNGRIPTRTNKHFISRESNIIHKLEHFEMFCECFEETILTVEKNLSEFNFLKISSGNSILLEFNNKDQINLGIDCVLSNNEIKCFKLPSFNPCNLNQSLIIESNIPVFLTISSRKIGKNEAKKMSQGSLEIFFEDIFFKEYTINEDEGSSAKIEPNINCAVTEMKIKIIGSELRSNHYDHLSFNFDELGFLSSKNILYDRYFKFVNNKFNDYYHLKADISETYLGANDKYIITPQNRKYIKVNGMKKNETIKILVMYKFVNVLHGTEKHISPYVWEQNKNTYPLTKVSDTEYIEGYWQVKQNWKNSDKYPWPENNDKPNSTEFTTKLVDLIKKLDKIKSYVSYFGSSSSRLDGSNVGSLEYFVNYSDITYRFPEGLTHYYCDSNVYPSDVFRNMVMNIDIDSITKHSKAE